MARIFETPIDLGSQNEIRKVVIQIIAGKPSEVNKVGRLIYNSTSKHIEVCTVEGNPGTWESLTTSGSAPEATSGAVGTIQLAEDLKGGTATAPKVSGFHLTGDGEAATHKIKNVVDPTEAQDAATKKYVDGKVNGLSWKQPVVAAATAVLPTTVVYAGSGATRTIEAGANQILEVDGVEIKTLGQRVLVAGQAEAKNNGIYELTKKGEAGAKWILTRTADNNTAAEMESASVLVEEGTANKDKAYAVTTDAITLETTNITWTEIQNGTAVKGEAATAVYIERSGNEIKLVIGGGLEGSSKIAKPAESAGTTNRSTLYTYAGRTAVFSFTGKAAVTTYTFKHELKTQAIDVRGQKAETEKPGAPIELDWKPAGENEVEIIFPEAPAATQFFVTVRA